VTRRRLAAIAWWVCWTLGVVLACAMLALAAAIGAQS
jgi:hypothetical protein